MGYHKSFNSWIDSKENSRKNITLYDNKQDAALSFKTILAIYYI